jgi:hypothetical protein
MAYRFLQRSLLFCLVVHVLAMLSMATVLAPAMDMTVDVATRAAWVAGHPWLWRLGWLPWQLCALSDVLVSLGIVLWVRGRPEPTRWAAKAWATLACLMTMAAVLPEQWAEGYAWLHMPSLEGAEYAAREAWLLVMTGTYGGLAYVGMLVCWVLFAAAMTPPSRIRTALLVLTAIDAALFVAAGLGVWRVTGEPGYPGFEVVGALNMVAFPLLAVINIILAGVLGQAAGRDFLGGVRDMFRPLPFLRMRSDITDVVYLNWWVPSERVRHLLPSPLVLDERDGMTALSILHYRHGGFGWAFLGPLRRLLPSPIQSNWRLYCQGGSIYFLHTLISSRGHALGARLFSDGLPAVFDGGMAHKRAGGELTVRASEPHLDAVLTEDVSIGLHPDTSYLIEQNGAVDADAIWGVVRLSAIDIPIDIDTVRPAAVKRVESRALADIVEGCPCFAFVVPAVSFIAYGDRVSRRLG